MKKKISVSFFWYDNDSGHQGPFPVKQPICASQLIKYYYLFCISFDVREIRSAGLCRFLLHPGFYLWQYLLKGLNRKITIFKPEKKKNLFFLLCFT